MESSKINNELLEYFVDFLKSDSGKSSGTIDNIKRDLKYFLDFLSANDFEIDEASIKSYLQVLEDKYTESSFISKSSSLRQFVNWLNLDNNPFWKMSLSISMDDYKYYQKEELEKIFTEDSYTSLLVRALYELYLSLDELVDLNLIHYNSAANTIRIRDKDLKLSSELGSRLKQFLKSERPSYLNKSATMVLDDPLFIMPQQNQLSPKRFNSIELLKVLSMLKLKNSFLKRSRIIHLIEEGFNSDQIEDYLAVKISDFFRPFFKDKSYRLLSAYNQFHPRAKLSNKP